MATLANNNIDGINDTIARGFSDATATAHITSTDATDTAVTVANYYRNYSRCIALATAAVVP